MMTAPSNVPGRSTSNWTRLWVDYERLIISMSGVIGFLSLWEMAGRLEWVRPLFISRPTAVLEVGFQMVRGTTLWRHLGVSATEFGLGFGLALLVGITLGLAMGRYKPVGNLFDPIVLALYSSPRLAMMPILITWFGIGMNIKIALVFVGAVFPILVNTIAGVKSVDKALIRAATSFGATERDLFVKIMLPGSVPYVLAGVQLGVGRGVLGVVIGEMYVGVLGIGYLIQRAGGNFRTAEVLFLVILVGFIAWAMVRSITKLQRRFDQWRTGG